MPYKCIPDNGVEDQIHLYFAVKVLMFITKKNALLKTLFPLNLSLIEFVFFKQSHLNEN